MSEAIVAAIIAALASVTGNLIVTSNARKKDAVERAKLDQKTADRLSSIERKLDEHNGYASKFEQIGKDITEIKTDLKHLSK